MAAVPMDRFAPQFRVQLGGKDLPADAAADILELAVEEDVDAPGMLTLQLANWDFDRGAVKWSDDSQFAEGVDITIAMGYSGQLTQLMTCDIVGLEPDFMADGVNLLSIRGYDRRHRLLRARRTRSFIQIKDSDIASQLGDDAGLTVSATDSTVVHEYVFQNNQSDLEFLQSRAKAIGYEVAVNDKTLYFRPRPIGQSETLTLSMNNDLIEFHPRLSAISQYSQVSTRGWDPTQKDSILAQSGDGDETAVMGKTTGPSSAKKAFGDAPLSLSDRPIRTQAEGDSISRGVYNEMALNYITGEGICVGRSDLRAGKVIRMSGLGERFSGLYYVTATVHSWNTRHGYRTAFTVRRNAS